VAAGVANPYAVIALGAALLGLFPVAIVFGILAATRPGGRVMAGWALALGLVEVAAVAGFVVLGVDHATDSTPAAAISTTAAAPATVGTLSTTTMLPLPPPPSAAPTRSSTATSAPTTTQTDTSATDTGPRGPAGAVNTPCAKSQNGLIGTAADGGALVCTNFGDDSGYKWSNAGPLAGGVHAPGATCDPLVSGGLTGHTADGHAVACEGDGHNGSWQAGQ
jgi:hypothetical protein